MGFLNKGAQGRFALRWHPCSLIRHQSRVDGWGKHVLEEGVVRGKALWWRVLGRWGARRSAEGLCP